MIQLTELGEEVYRECRIKIKDLEMSVMEGIAKEEQKLAFEILPKIQENIMNKEGN